ncbi:hypothetical protein FHR49_002257 [Xanthomonas campestris]
MLDELRALAFYLETEFVKTHNSGVTWESKGTYIEERTGYQIDGVRRAAEFFQRASVLTMRLQAVNWAIAQIEAGHA